MPNTSIRPSPAEEPACLWLSTLGIWISAFLYGAYCILFARAIQILLRRLRTLERQAPLLLAIAVLFLLSTAQILCLTVKAAVATGGLAPIPLGPVSAASVLVYVSSCVCSDALLIYRCFVIWQNKFFVIVPPTALLAVSAVFGYMQELRLFQILSLTTALSVSLLTASRVAYSVYQRREFLSDDAQRRYMGISATIFESGLIYTLFVSVHFAAFQAQSPAAPVIFAAVGQIVGMAPTMIIVRAGLPAPLDSRGSFAISATTTGGGVRSTLVSVRAGNMLDLRLPGPLLDFSSNPLRWTGLYGGAYKLAGFFGRRRIMLSDPAAMHAVLADPETFAPGPVFDLMMRWMFGEDSVVRKRGSEHSHIRAFLNVGFTPAAVKRYEGVFVRVAGELCDNIEARRLVSDSDINFSPLLRSAALDAVCEATFGHPARTLGDDFVRTNSALGTVAAAHSSFQLLAEAIISLLPTWLARFALSLPSANNSVMRDQLRISNLVGRRVVDDVKAKDCLALPEDGMLSVFEVVLRRRMKRVALEEGLLIAQTSILTIAGQDSTANTLLFACLELAQTPQLQNELREEILRFRSGPEPRSYDTLPLLNALIKETLRFYPSVPFIERVALRDNVIPLSLQPKTHLALRRGQIVTVDIASYQRASRRWGINASKFDPRRWLDGRVQNSDAPGPLTFSSGPHVCLGWRFAILEMQIFLCAILQRFELLEPNDESWQPRYLTTLVPTRSDGSVSAVLHVNSIIPATFR
ncbi:Cytochrome P450 [Mycena kentingensis (nom. inval.)]|nr:Cytochrome P450 [Mycena kentingensis (nom. inval.)]